MVLVAVLSIIETNHSAEGSALHSNENCSGAKNSLKSNNNRLEHFGQELLLLQ